MNICDPLPTPAHIWRAVVAVAVGVVVGRGSNFIVIIICPFHQCIEGDVCYFVCPVSVMAANGDRDMDMEVTLSRKGK